MSRIITLPHKYDDELMSLVADGKQLTEIRDIIQNKYKIEVKLNTLNGRITTLKTRNAEIARAALSEQVVKTTINHTQIFENDIRKLEQVISKCFDNEDNKTASLLLGNKLRIQQQHLSLLGLDKPIENDDDILRKLAGR
jgi:hypothetical protein